MRKTSQYRVKWEQKGWFQA